MSRATRILAIDYGLARIGLAMSDERKIIALSLPTLLAEKKAEDTAAKLAKEIAALSLKQKFEVEKIVLGLPLKMDGTKGLQADEVSHFAELLKQYIHCPILFWDERLTSVQADRSLREGQMNRKQRAKRVDQVAAVLILQSYLDSIGPIDS